MKATSMATHRWHLLIYQVTSLAAQQRILRRISEMSSEGVIALGSSQEAETFVVAECSDLLAVYTVEQLVADLDPGAVLTYRSQHG